VLTKTEIDENSLNFLQDQDSKEYIDINWEDCLPEVTDQNTCSNCWAHVTSNIVTAKWNILNTNCSNKKNKLNVDKSKRASVQQIMNCVNVKSKFTYSKMNINKIPAEGCAAIKIQNAMTAIEYLNELVSNKYFQTVSSTETKSEIWASWKTPTSLYDSIEPQECTDDALSKDDSRINLPNTTVTPYFIDLLDGSLTAEERIIKALRENGPVFFSIQVSQQGRGATGTFADALMKNVIVTNKHCGNKDGSSDFDLQHSMTIYGYREKHNGKEDGKPVWLVRNSWGNDREILIDATPGQNTCGILKMVLSLQTKVTG